MKKYIVLSMLTLFLNSCIKETTIIYNVDNAEKDLALDGLWKDDKKSYLLYNNRENILNVYTNNGIDNVILKYPFYVENGQINCNYIYSRGYYKILGDSLSVTISNQYGHFGFKREKIDVVKNWIK